MRDEFTGMLPGAIAKFEELLKLVPGTKILNGFNGSNGENDLRTWGVVCDLKNSDMNLLVSTAETLGIDYDGEVSFAYTNNLTIHDFKTYRVNGDIVLMPSEPTEPEIIEEEA